MAFLTYMEFPVFVFSLSDIIDTGCCAALRAGYNAVGAKCHSARCAKNFFIGAYEFPAGTTSLDALVTDIFAALLAFECRTFQAKQSSTAGTGETAIGAGDMVVETYLERFIFFRVILPAICADNIFLLDSSCDFSHVQERTEIKVVNRQVAGVHFAPFRGFSVQGALDII